MKLAQNILLGVVILLSFAAGLAKVMQTPQEVTFFESLGLNTSFLVALGILQITGAALMLRANLRRWGAALAAGALLTSMGMIFISGQIGFGMFSILPVLLSMWVFVISKE